MTRTYSVGHILCDGIHLCMHKMLENALEVGVVAEDIEHRFHVGKDANSADEGCRVCFASCAELVESSGFLFGQFDVGL